MLLDFKDCMQDMVQFMDFGVSVLKDLMEV